MQVFKAYLQIIRKNAPLLVMYLGIVIALAIMMSVFNAQGTQTGFTGTKINLAFFNDDSGSETGISSGLQEFLVQNAAITAVADNPEAIKDALFYGKISYVVRVPSGFSQSFARNEAVHLQRLAAPDSTTSIFMDMLINRYLNTARIYRQGLPAATPAEIMKLTADNLKISTPVELKSFQARRGSYDNVVYFYNYLAYSLLSILILGVSTCMLTFNNIDLRRRNLCSPMTMRSMNLQLVAGNLVFSLFSWLVMVIVSCLLYSGAMFSPTGLLFGMNSFVFMLVGLCLSFFIGNTLRSRNAQAAVANVLTLGTSFIAGVFVPQAILGQTVLGIARFTPTFWYVKANSSIGSLANFKIENLGDIYSAMMIQLLFAAALLAASFIVIRRKRQKA